MPVSQGHCEDLKREHKESLLAHINRALSEWECDGYDNDGDDSFNEYLLNICYVPGSVLSKNQ